jgi:hypothetical protein
MLQKQNKLQNQMCFQIHKNGGPSMTVSYPTLVEASVALEKGAQGGEVTAVDGLDQIVTALHCGRMPHPPNFR